MKRSPLSIPEQFSVAPLLSLLPKCGDVNKLQALLSSFFARYEKTRSMIEEVRNEEDRDALRRCIAEEEMLREVLEWLQIDPISG